MKTTSFGSLSLTRRANKIVLDNMTPKNQPTNQFQVQNKILTVNTTRMQCCFPLGAETTKPT